MKKIVEIWVFVILHSVSKINVAKGFHLISKIWKVHNPIVLYKLNSLQQSKKDNDDSFNDETPQRKANRRPVRQTPGYWQNISNVENELRLFWSSMNVPISESDPPPIPNEALLNYFNRHDLRYGIYTQGGREIVSKMLNGARIMPGKWMEAVETSPELKKLLNSDNPKSNGLSKDLPPMPLQVKRRIEENRSKVNHDGTDPIERYYDQRWAHRSGRKPKGYWTKELAISEL